MKRTRTRTLDDLNEEQRAIHDALPPGMRETYLFSLGPVDQSELLRRRKVDQLDEYLRCLDAGIEALRKLRGRIDKARTDLARKAVEPADVNLREYWQAPEVEGMKIIFERKRRDLLD